MGCQHDTPAVSHPVQEKDDLPSVLVSTAKGVDAGVALPGWVGVDMLNSVYTYNEKGQMARPRCFLLYDESGDVVSVHEGKK